MYSVENSQCCHVKRNPDLLRHDWDLNLPSFVKPVFIQNIHVKTVAVTEAYYPR